MLRRSRRSSRRSRARARRARPPRADARARPRSPPGSAANIDDARRELTELRRGLASDPAPLGPALAGGGHASRSRSPRTSASRARDRYRYLVEQLQYVARRELVFGMHVHVAVPDPDTCLKVMEGVLIELPILLAISSNSPFWRGERDGPGLDAHRRLRRLSALGPAPALRQSYDDYAETVGWMEGTGAIVDYTRLWWDVRPAPSARHARGARARRAVRPRVRARARGLRPVARAPS